jgi:hypothetical protein
MMFDGWNTMTRSDWSPFSRIVLMATQGQELLFWSWIKFEQTPVSTTVKLISRLSWPDAKLCRFREKPLIPSILERVGLVFLLSDEPLVYMEFGSTIRLENEKVNGNNSLQNPAAHEKN